MFFEKQRIFCQNKFSLRVGMNTENTTIKIFMMVQSLMNSSFIYNTMVQVDLMQIDKLDHINNRYSITDVQVDHTVNQAAVQAKATRL